MRRASICAENVKQAVDALRDGDMRVIREERHLYAQLLQDIWDEYSRPVPGGYVGEQFDGIGG